MSARWEVKAVRYATLLSTRGENFYRYPLYGEPDGPLVLDYFFWLLRRAGRTILLDTGFDPAVGLRRGREVLVAPIDALSALGVAAAEVDRILVSHLHYDHVGNLSAFPNATVLVQHRELEFWTGPIAGRLQFASVVEAPEIDAFGRLAAEGRLEVCDGDVEVEEGIELRLLGGHCPGEQIAVVDTEAGRVVLASDALHFYEEMERDRPFLLFSDLPATYRAYEVLRELERADATIVAGHDPRVLERFETFPLSPGSGSVLEVA